MGAAQAAGDAGEADMTLRRGSQGKNGMAGNPALVRQQELTAVRRKVAQPGVLAQRQRRGVGFDILGHGGLPFSGVGGAFSGRKKAGEVRENRHRVEPMPPEDIGLRRVVAQQSQIRHRQAAPGPEVKEQFDTVVVYVLIPSSSGQRFEQYARTLTDVVGIEAMGSPA